MSIDMTTPVRYLKGVGEAREKRYHRLGIETVGELVSHYPRAYIDLSHPYTIKMAPVGEIGAIRATLTQKGKEQRIRKGLSLFKLVATDGESDLLLTYFNSQYAVAALEVGQTYLFYGKIGGNILRREMNSPGAYREADAPPFIPVYSLTAGLSSLQVLKNVRQALGELPAFTEPLPQDIRQQYSLATYDFAMRQIHLPQNTHEIDVARRRLVFDELFTLSLGLALARSSRETVTRTPMQPRDMTPFYESLPFTPTAAQLRAIGDGIRDMCSARPMNRLLQGDVGSGKTLVAAGLAYFTALNQKQSAMMAPTEILATQHHHNLQRTLEPLGVRVELITGRMKAADKRDVLWRLRQGEIDLLIGTHALISRDVTFRDLALVITDEQHRFGVEQRLELSNKGENPCMLVMSATPIPRTLSLIIYGDLDLSILDERPPGRKDIPTYRIDSSKRLRALGFIKRFLDEGKQAYIVCPLIEEGENTADLVAATSYMEELATHHFQGYTVGLLHGKMSAKDKQAIMAAFVAGKLQLLVSTTVIEVGVDVPDACVMMIENAERFGLSQLHQLRGRVGRSNEQAHCILLSDAGGEETKRRLDIMCQTNDGFQIAEEDLKLRGPGDFLGRRQHGLPLMRIADLSADMALFEQAKEAAKALLRIDPHLEQHPLLLSQVRALMKTTGELLN